LYISKEWLCRKTGGVFASSREALGPILMCEEGARRRNLDLAVAGADARYWWETQTAPLRATPVKSSRKESRSPEQVGKCRKCGSQIKQWGFNPTVLSLLMQMAAANQTSQAQQLGRSIGAICARCKSAVCAVCYEEKLNCPECGESIEF
jgi:hypothetical protein